MAVSRHSKLSSQLQSKASLRKQESDDEPEINPEGRLIVCGGKTKKEKAIDPDSDVRSEAGSFKSVNSRKTQKRRKTSDSGWAGTGNEYASKKAGGDLRRKDKLETYAYWPLDRKMMSRRPEHRAAAWKGMARVVKMTKKLEGKSASTALSMKLINFNCQKKGSKRKSR
ncbi:RRP12-like protein [Populus alba x Populus x berolinensis]|uniref:RRP12-like protein n=1 Tax=Populus alba x Populus x berolinensis TaxID=444605 RepID=A0AAD6PQN3_9ROSI|nr:RRP12-like protein [Populus alba x Populus x berolinensis]